jgi:hypothetical protein
MADGFQTYTKGLKLLQIYCTGTATVRAKAKLMRLGVPKLRNLGDLLSTGRGVAVLPGVRSLTFTIFRLPVMIVAEAEFSHRYL